MSDLLEKDVKKGCGLIVGTVVGLPVLAAYFTLADGYVLGQLWAWYAVPLGARPVSWQTFGAAVLAWNVWKNGRTPPKDERTEFEVAAWLAGVLLVPWVALLLGWWLR